MGVLRGEVQWRAAMPAWAARPVPADVTYGGALFARASSFVRGRAEQRDPDGDPATAKGDRTSAWHADIGGAVALVRLARNLPRLEVRLTDSDAGRAIRHALAGRTLGVPRNRLCAAVLDVPDVVPDRPSGKRNQALRTALTAAEKGGVKIRQVTDVQERRRIASSAARAVPRLTTWSHTAAEHDEHEWWIAEDGAAGLVGIATVVRDVDWASLVTLVGIPGSDMESQARYALHHAVVQSLSAAGVGHLAVLDHSPLLLDAGPQHIQRVLGYRPTRLRRPVRLARDISEKDGVFTASDPDVAASADRADRAPFLPTPGLTTGR